MDDERLAKYLAGELEDDERRAFEDALTTDAQARLRLDAVEAVDRDLAALADVPLPAGFEERLLSRLQPEIDAVLGDELAARRRRQPRWLVPAAAAAAVIGAVAVGVTQFGPASDGDMGPLALESAESADLASDAVAAYGPAINADNRTFDETSLDQLLTDDRFQQLLDEKLDPESGAIRAGLYAAAFGVGAPQAVAQESVAGGAEADSGEVAGAPEAPLADDGQRSQELTEYSVAGQGLTFLNEVTEAQVEQVRTCLPTLLEGGDRIPLYAEFAGYEGEEAIIFGLVALDPESDNYNRVELWVISADDCFVLHFQQSAA